MHLNPGRSGGNHSYYKHSCQLLRFLVTSNFEKNSPLSVIAEIRQLNKTKNYFRNY